MEEGNGRFEVEYIPPNFKEGVSILGFMIRVPYVLQAVPVVAIVLILIFTAGGGLNGLFKLVLAIILCVPVLFICAVGINGDSLYGFLRNMIRSKKENRTYIYNPRIKTEIRPLSESPDSVEMLPREKILTFIENRRAVRDEKVDYGRFRYDNMFFEDDTEYMKKTGKNKNTRK